MVVKPRGPLVSLTAAVGSGVCVFFSLYSLIPVTRSGDPGASSAYVGTLMAFVIAVQVFAPAFVRRFSLRVVLCASLALLACGALLTGLATGTLLLLGGGVISGASFGTLIVVGAQGVALLVPAEGLGRALGVYGLVTMSASALGSPAGVQLALSTSPGFFGVCAFAVALLGAACSLGVPSGVGRSAPGARPRRSARGRARLLAAGAPWLALTFLLVAVLLLSHGLTTLPVIDAAHGHAAMIVFAVQAANALGRGAGGELEARTTSPITAGVGAVLLAAGGVLGAASTAPLPTICAGALIGLGVGIVQSLTLHVAMRRMSPGSASVAWNLGVDGGLWLGGMLWALASATAQVEIGAVVVCALLLALGAMVVRQLSRTPLDG